MVTCAGGVLRLVAVTSANLMATLALEVHPVQRDFVASTAESLAECYVYPRDIPRLALLDETPVGFVLVRCGEPEDGKGRRFFLERLLVDRVHQGRGIGRALIDLVIDWAARFEPRPEVVVLGVVPGNIVARGLYERMGFEPTGEVRQGEAVMERALAPHPVAARAGRA